MSVPGLCARRVSRNGAPDEIRDRLAIPVVDETAQTAAAAKERFVEFTAT